MIDEAIPARSAVILTQTGLPDPLEQVLNHKPVFDGRLSVREIQRGWDLKAELVTLSACETALGREAGGEGFVGFTQALLMSGARSVCLSLWKVDDTATALLMQRFYANLLGRRTGLSGPMPKAEALREAKAWLRGPAPLGGADHGRGAIWRRRAWQREPRPASRPISPPRSRRAVTTIGRTHLRTTGPRSCSSATRIERPKRYELRSPLPLMLAPAARRLIAQSYFQIGCNEFA